MPSKVLHSLIHTHVRKQTSHTSHSHSFSAQCFNTMYNLISTSDSDVQIKLFIASNPFTPPHLIQSKCNPTTTSHSQLTDPYIHLHAHARIHTLCLNAKRNLISQGFRYPNQCTHQVESTHVPISFCRGKPSTHNNPVTGELGRAALEKLRAREQSYQLNCPAKG